MNKSVKILIVLFAVLIACSLAEGREKTKEGDLTEEDMQNLNEMYEQMRLEENAAAASQKIWNSFSVRSDGTWNYPDDFGGMFIDGQYLYIYVKNLSEENRQYYLSLIGNLKDYVKFLDAKYSRNELQGIANEIREEALKQGCLLYGIGVDDIQNGIHIYTSQEFSDAVKTLSALMAPDIPVIVDETSAVSSVTI